MESNTTSKSCTDCIFFIAHNNEKAQQRAYGGAVHFDSCSKTGRFLSPSDAFVTDEDKRTEYLQEVAEGCGQYAEIENRDMHRVPTHRSRRTPLQFALQADLAITDKVSKAKDSLVRRNIYVHTSTGGVGPQATKSCASCIFRMDPQDAQHTFGVTGAVCMARGGILPDSEGSNRGTASECSMFEQVSPAESLPNFKHELHHNLLGEVMVTPGLQEFMSINDSVGYTIRERIEANKPFEFVEPSTYKTDMEVSEDDKADGIRAWRKLYSTNGERSVVIPIFDPEFFSEDERKKIPQSGDKEHPELYQDHPNNAFKVATLWFKMDETPLLQGVPGTGKGHPVDTKVLTPQGWNRVGDLQVGDHVVGSDGKPTRVRGVFDRGVLPVNRVTMTDGSSVLVDNDHIWNVTTLKGVNKNVDTTWLKGQDLKGANGRHKFAIPMVEPVEFEEKNLPIHPYMLGVMLANGSLGANEAIFTTNNEAIVDRCINLGYEITEGSPTPSRRWKVWAPMQWSNGAMRRKRGTGLWHQLGQAGLAGKKSADKFIPEEYMHASEAQRRELLAGLMDCDGSRVGNHTRYHTTSEHLANGVVELVQSLGGTASKQYSSRDGEISVNITAGDNPFTGAAEVKHSRWEAGNGRAPVRKIKSIESAGTAEVRCISVEAADELYVTEDYIVTHNTEFYRYMSWLMQMPFERISITGSSELDDLAGKMLFENNETVFQKGRIPKAWEKPSVLCLDEPNVGPLEVWQFIRPLTDNSKQLVLDMADGETVARHKYCRLGMAINPSWDSRNIGAQPLADADSNRLSHIFVDFPGEKIERNILTNRCKADGYELAEVTLDKIMKVATQLREMGKAEDLPVTWGIRQQIKVARATEYFDLEDCYKMAVTDNLEPEIADTILNVVRLVERGNVYAQGGVYTHGGYSPTGSRF